MIFGGLDLADGSTVPWWRVKEAAMVPEGVRDIGSACYQVAALYASNITIDGEVAATRPWVRSKLPTWDTLSNKPEWTGQLAFLEVGQSILPPQAVNYDVACANSLLRQ